MYNSDDDTTTIEEEMSKVVRHSKHIQKKTARKRMMNSPTNYLSTCVAHGAPCFHLGTGISSITRKAFSELSNETKPKNQIIIILI